MNDWRRYTIRQKGDHTYNTLSFWLDYYVEFASGWQSSWITCEKGNPFDTWQVGDQIEIDNDTTRKKTAAPPKFYLSSSYYSIRKGSSAAFPPSHLYCSPGDEGMREVPSASVVSSSSSTRNAMVNASSADPTALSVTQELADRVDRGQQTEMEFKMQSNTGNNYHWIYKKS